MTHGICWNLLECVGMAHGMGWNGLEWPLESGGSNHSSGFRMEFHGIPSGIHWNESTIPPDSNGIQVEFHSNRFQVHSARFQGPFQPITWAIPTHSNKFQHIPTHSMGHSNTFQWISSAIQMSCDLVWAYLDNLILRIPYSIWVWLVKTKIYWKQLPKFTLLHWI